MYAAAVLVASYLRGQFLQLSGFREQSPRGIFARWAMAIWGRTMSAAHWE